VAVKPLLQERRPVPQEPEQQSKTSRSNPEFLRAKAELFQKAAARNPEKREALLKAARLGQLAASVAENGLPQKPAEASE